MLPGIAGAVIIVTASVCADEEPHELFAVTVMFPPEEPAVALIELEVDAPVQPEGNVHV